MDTWRIASTRISSTAANRMRSGRVISPPRRIPGGTLHAYRSGDDHTACGELLAPMKRWPAKRFGRGTLARARCRRCEASVRAARR